jgi:ferredoxin
MTTILVSGAILLLLLMTLRTYSTKKNKAQKEIHIDTAQCTGCGVCLKKCRRNVLIKVCDVKGSHVQIQHADNCSVCGDCVRACKFNALTLLDKTSK